MLFGHVWRVIWIKNEVMGNFSQPVEICQLALYKQHIVLVYFYLKDIPVIDLIDILRNVWVRDCRQLTHEAGIRVQRRNGQEEY